MIKCDHCFLQSIHCFILIIFVIYRYECYQVNEEKRRMARQLLKMIIPLQPDHLLVGADADDILHALSCKYLNEYFSFSIDESHRRKTVSEEILSQQQQSQLPPRHVHIGQQLEVSTAGGTTVQEMMLLDGEEMLGDGYDEDFALFEQRAVIFPGEALLGNGNSGSSDYDAEGFEDDEQSFRNRTLPEEQQQLQRVLPATELVTLGYQQRQQNAAMSTAPSDYEQDSFIVEDNDEGDLSLPASSTNGTILLQQQEQEQDRLTQLQMFRDYARAPATFMDMLMHEAVCMDDWCEFDDEEDANNNQQRPEAYNPLLPSVEARFALLNSALPINGSSRRMARKSFSFILNNSRPSSALAEEPAGH